MKSPWQMIKQAYLSFVTDDSSVYPKGQAGYNDKTTDFLRYSPYGLCSNPPLGSWVLLLSAQGQEAVKIGLVADLLNRKEGLKEGEAVLYNTLTKSFVLLKENGDIEVDAKNDLVANVAGSATITAVIDIKLTAPILLLNGAVGVGGVVTIPATNFDIGMNAITFKEMTAPATPGVDAAALYIKDNGSGKTQVVIKFQDGSESVLATQP